MSTKYERLLEGVHELHDLEKSMMLLSWDKQVNMPKAGMTARTQQLTTLRRLIHAGLTSDKMGEMIEAAAGELETADYDSNEASLIRYLRRTHQDERKLTESYVKRASKVGGEAHLAWLQARDVNDFSLFRPWLEQVVDLCREKAELYGYEDEAYDALLDKYEHGMKTADVRALFAEVTETLVPLRQAIDDSAVSVNDSVVHQSFDVEAQKDFARYIAAAVGYEFGRGHLGTAVHPFATSFSRDDARITTRWYPDFLNASLFGTLHESGHAMYEQGTGKDLARTPLARGTSLGIHESQSRMMENIVGRSYGFWRAHFPKLRATFPDQLKSCTVDEFYRAVNKVQPSFIRVEADELTYSFHIILRFELEQALLTGDLAVADLPAAWGDKMQDLLGVTPPNDSQGCLQDVHWTSPGFGYFPTYALGNLYAAQFHEAALAQNPAIGRELDEGRTGALLAWLGENVHRHGRKFTPGELVQRVTGKPLDPKPFMKYVTTKFGRIYELDGSV